MAYHCSNGCGNMPGRPLYNKYCYHCGEKLMAIKTYQLMKLEELGVFYRGAQGEWFINVAEDLDLTEYLSKAGMFEQ